MDANKRGNFHRLTFQTGGYLRNDKIEDFVIQAGAAYFTRALNVKRSKIRGLLSADYTQIINRTVNDWLNVTDKYIPGFSTDSLTADRPISHESSNCALHTTGNFRISHGAICSDRHGFGRL